MEPLSRTRHEDDLSPLTLGLLAVLFVLALMSLIYLSDYSMGPEFSEAPPQFRPEQLQPLGETASR